jgi:hypothetical protein
MYISYFELDTYVFVMQMPLLPTVAASDNDYIICCTLNRQGDAAARSDIEMSAV